MPSWKSSSWAVLTWLLHPLVRTHSCQKAQLGTEPEGGARDFCTRMGVAPSILKYPASFCEPVSGRACEWWMKTLMNQSRCSCCCLGPELLPPSDRAKLPISACARGSSATAQLPVRGTGTEGRLWVSLNTEGFPLWLLRGRIEVTELLRGKN